MRFLFLDKMYKIESVAKEQFIWFDISVLYILFLYLHNDIKTDVRKETNEDPACIKLLT